MQGLPEYLVEQAEASSHYSGTASLVDMRLIHTLALAPQIQTHKAFYEWLQGDVQAFLPHETLVAAWGDFDNRKLGFDVASCIAGVSTRALLKSEKLKVAMERLHGRVAAMPGNWCVIRGLREIIGVCGADLGIDFYRALGGRTRTLLVHTQRCARAGYDCIYVFMISDSRYRFEPLALEILLPHLDQALRRIECLACDDEDARALAARVNSLSDREHEVVAWVSQGKSNEEIGAILGISHNTVKNHLKRVFSKMGVTARSQAVRAYMQGQERYLGGVRGE